MKREDGFTIELSSRFKEWWRYNVSLMCGCFSATEERTDFRNVASEVAPAGSNLPSRPENIEPQRRVRLTAPECNHLMLYAYIVPHTLPHCALIEDAEPFKATLKISFNGQLLREEHLVINQWSGASLELRVEPPR